MNIFHYALNFHYALRIAHYALNFHYALLSGGDGK